MFICDFCGETKGGDWVKSKELSPLGSIKCKECFKKKKKKKKKKLSKES